MNKRIISALLVLSLIISAFAVGSYSALAAQTDKATTAAGSTEPQKTIQGSNILHCFDWSYNSIKANLKAIKDAGYTAVQTSPVQPPKDYSSSWRDQGGQWWKLYQPLGIRISDGNSWLGTKSELKALCSEADKYGLKVVVDIVANHLADQGKYCNGLGNVSTQVDGDLRRDEYWHNDQMSADDDNNRYKVTHGAIGLPDLNTGHGTIQNKFKSLLSDCVSCGVDGFRFDAAKHIELPGENGGSDFWPTVLSGAKNAFVYGEILNGAGTSIGNYTRYMSVTDNEASDYRLFSAQNGNAQGLAASGAGDCKGGLSIDKSVLWCESHDTYMGDSGVKIKNTKNVSNNVIVKCWAIVGSRAGSTGLFFARPAANMGDASSDTTYKSKAVAEVNKFKNYFDGEGEYLSSQGDVAYNERGTTGVVISKLGGGGSVNLSAHKMKDGTYKDQVSGGTFKVSGGKISGNVDSSGVAVVYNATAPGPSVSIDCNGSNEGGSIYGATKVTLHASNTSSQTYQLGSDSAKSYSDGDTITVGSNLSEGQSVTLKLSGTSKDGKSVSASYTFTKKKVPALPGNMVVYYDNSQTKWPAVYCYAFVDETVNNGPWPGAKMQKVDGNIWGLALNESWGSVKVIFSNNGSDQTSESGNPISNGQCKILSGDSWNDYPKYEGDSPVNPPSGKGLYGDANSDNAINIKDATELQKHFAKITNLSSVALAKCDVNSDGTVSIKDATCIQYYIAKMYNYSGKVGQSTSGGGSVTPATQAPTNPTVATDNYIYFKNTNGWNPCNAYFWSEENLTMMSWPGSAMENVSGDIFRAKIPDGATKVIFTIGNDGGKTADLDIPGPGKIFDNGNWSDYK
ncbi:MAG: starch-binding protein [Ruminococcus sp.]|nr:starch-binding protein [Ruminococcus sp.]